MFRRNVLPPSSGLRWARYKQSDHETQGEADKNKELDLSRCEGTDKKTALIGAHCFLRNVGIPPLNYMTPQPIRAQS
jgi:hypothetical protein